MLRVLGVGFVPIACRPDELRRRRHQTRDPAVAEKTGQLVAGRPSLIGHLHRLRQRLQPAPKHRADPKATTPATPGRCAHPWHAQPPTGRAHPTRRTYAVYSLRPPTTVGTTDMA